MLFCTCYILFRFAFQRPPEATGSASPRALGEEAGAQAFEGRAALECLGCLGSTLIHIIMTSFQVFQNKKKQPSDQSNTTSIPSGRWKLLFMLYVAVFTCEKVDLFRRTLIVVMDVVFLRGGLQKQEVHCINGHPHMVDGIEAVGVKSLDMS